MIELRIPNSSWRPKFHISDILDFVDCKMSSRIDFKALWPRKGHAWGLMPQPYCIIDDMTNIRFQRLAQPDTCSDGLYKIIMKCWEFDHRKRPDFTALLSLLQNYDGST